MTDVDDVEGLLESELTAEDLEGSDNKDANNGDASLVTDDSLLDDTIDDPELEAIKARVREMEAEQEKLKQMQDEVEKQLISGAAGGPGALGGRFPTQEEKLEADQRSVHVANVDYTATAEELESHFNGCGAINRVTILCDKFTGHPKGFAYIEFNDKESIDTALVLNDSLFKGRTIKVTAKRFNVPGVSSTNRSRGRGRAAGGFRGGFRPPGFGGYRPVYRGRGGYRPRRAWYTPY